MAASYNTDRATAKETQLAGLEDNDQAIVLEQLGDAALLGP